MRVASLNIKITELSLAYAAYANMFNLKGSKCLPKYQDLIKYIIKIIEGAKLPYYRCYKYSERELKLMREWLDKMLAIGKIKFNKSPCASPVLMAKKPHLDKLRPCVDY